MDEPFYVSGLKFSCKRCSVCCRHDAGFVFLSESDLDKLTAALKMDKDKVIKMYCRWVKDWKGEETLSLKEKQNKDCILWDGGCSVYNERPLQCINFPFWESILSSSKSWKITALDCPGINTGKLHTKEMIDELLQKNSVFPIINKKRGEL
ncbi:MAG: YkgJ family cysteine cluster protein [Treponema sp.]|jgi:Fe-S-cluster containining protein|nr:YkgJ family cysteine cluster protein [Treponema sp.]